MWWIIGISFAVLAGVVIALYALPADNSKTARRKEKRQEAVVQEKPKDKQWQSIAERWERQNGGLLADIEKMKMENKKVLQDIDAQKAKNKELVEKLSLEKSWREKEQVNSDKSKAHEHGLKEQIFRTEADLEKEHTGRLRVERELQELKIKHDATADEKRQLSTKAMSLETTVAQLSKEIKDLKRTNEDLGRKREDVQWVAKSEFEELKKQFAAKEQEFARLKKTLGT